MPEPGSNRTSRGVVLLTALLIAAAAVWSILANLPDRRLHDLGGLIRRAGDVTPERVFRLRMVGYSLGIAFAFSAAYVWRNRSAVARFFAEAWDELRGIRSEGLKWWNSLAIANRASFALILAIGAALRLYYLNTPMAYDEAYSFTNFARRPLVEALSDYNNTNNHLLNTFFMHVMYMLFGQKDWALRLPVCFAGILLVAFSFPWARARIGAAPALAAMALVAASPMMVDYSVNARGYTFLALFAVALDGCFLRIALAQAGTPRAATWITATLLVWLGFSAMPTYAHPLAALLVWFTMEARIAGRKRAQVSNAIEGTPSNTSPLAGEVAAERRVGGMVASQQAAAPPTASSRQVGTSAPPPQGGRLFSALPPVVGINPFASRLASICCMLFASSLLTATTYAPAFVFRGTHARLQNDFVQPLPLQQWANEFPMAVWKGVERWIAGGFHGAVLLVFAWGGVVAWFRRSLEDRRAAGWGGIALLSVFATPLALMALQRLAPPPRLFFWLAPWFFLLIATGAAYAVGLLQRFRLPWSGDSIMRFFAYAASAAGIWFAFEHPILREPHQREFGIGSVPSAMKRLKSLVGAGEAHRVYSPLPCDHPAIYYADKFGIAGTINGPPRIGERLYLLARPGDDPTTTLRNVAVKQDAFVEAIGPWVELAEFPELTLWEASRRFQPPIQ